MSYNGADVIFPHLNIVIDHLRDHVTVFGFDITFYGMIIGIGLLSGLFLAECEAKRKGDDPDLYVDFIIYAIIFSVIGARAYYVAFQWDYYKGDILRIIDIRQGGIAIYGAVIGAFLTAFVYTRIKKYPFFRLTDTAVPGLILGQAIGRWGNFFNCEAFGGYTDSLFAMRIRGGLVNPSMLNAEILHNLIEDAGFEYIQVHPTFLYESVWDLLVMFILLWFARHRQKHEGQTTLMYFLCYGTGRFFIEGMRTDQLLIPGTGIAVSQCLSAVFAAAAAVILLLLPRICEKLELKRLKMTAVSSDDIGEEENGADGI